MLDKFTSKDEMYKYYQDYFSPFITPKRNYTNMEWKHWLHLFSIKPSRLLLLSKRNLVFISITIIFLIFNEFEIEKISFMGIVIKYEESSLFNLLMYILIYFIVMHLLISINDFIEKSLVRYKFYHRNYFGFDDKQDEIFYNTAKTAAKKEIEENKKLSYEEIQKVVNKYIEMEHQIENMKDRLREIKSKREVQLHIDIPSHEMNLDDKLAFENKMFRKELYVVFYYMIIYFLPLMLGGVSLYLLLTRETC